MTKPTTIKVSELTRIKVNQYKYKFNLDNHDQVIQRLFEIASKMEAADVLSSKLEASTKRGRSDSQKSQQHKDTHSALHSNTFFSSPSSPSKENKQELEA